MEKEYFDWQGWDEVDTFVLHFYDVTLKKQIGKFPVGTKFDGATIDFEKGFLTLSNNGPEENGFAPEVESHSFKTNLVVEEIK